MIRQLTVKQARFIDEYLVDLNATQAAKRAGYSERTADVIGTQLLRKTSVTDAVNKAREARAKRTNLNADWVMKRLVQEATREGEGSSHSARVRALELIGKHLGMFTTKVEMSGRIGSSDVDEMSDEERARRIMQLFESVRARVIQDQADVVVDNHKTDN